MVKQTQLIVFLVFNMFNAFGQTNDISAVLLSRESDHEYRYKSQSREQVLISFEDKTVYYRKRATQKFKISRLPLNYFFKDSINYDELDQLLIGKTNETDLNCEFRNYGSIRISVIYGSSSLNYTKSFEFGSVISCREEEYFAMLYRIQQEYSLIAKQLFN